MMEMRKYRSAEQRQFAPFVETTVVDQIREMLIEGFGKHPMKRNISEELVAATSSWAIYGAAKQRAHSSERVAAEQFVGVAMKLVQPVIMAGVEPEAGS